jgi:hypothetical protein
MYKYFIIILSISIGFPQFSIKDKQIYNYTFNKYYSDDEFITSLNSDTAFLNDKNFLNYKKYVNRLKFKKSKYIYLISLASIGTGIDGIQNPEEHVDNDSPPGSPHIMVGLLLSSSYYGYNKINKDRSLFYVVQKYNERYDGYETTDSIPPYNYLQFNLGVSASFGLNSEKGIPTLVNSSLLINITNNLELFTTFGTILFGGYIAGGFKYYINSNSDTRLFTSISRMRGSFGVSLDSHQELSGILFSLGYSLKSTKRSFLNIGYSYVFASTNEWLYDNKSEFGSPFINMEFR